MWFRLYIIDGRGRLQYCTSPSRLLEGREPIIDGHAKIELQSDILVYSSIEKIVQEICRSRSNTFFPNCISSKVNDVNGIREIRLNVFFGVGSSSFILAVGGSNNALSTESRTSIFHLMDSTYDENITVKSRDLLHEVYENYSKLKLDNSFGSIIVCPAFDQKIRTAAQRFGFL
ncbi:hypothetical protein ACOME3_007193 [Neoechinorhynchus agilis]